MLKTTIFTHRLHVSLARFFFCWWRHNRLLMTSQWPDNGDAITRIMISNSLDIDFIHGDIHGGSCKKYQSLVLVCGCGNLSIPSIAISAWSGAAEGQAKCTASPFSDLDPRSQLWHWITKIACLHDKVGTTRPSLQNLAAIPLVMLITWLDFGGILLKFFFGIFCLNISDGFFFKVKHSIGHISGMAGPNDMKQKGGASVGYWVNYIWPSLLTSPMTLTLDFSRSNFQIAVSPELLSDWCETKRGKSSRYWTVWTCPLTTPVTLTLKFQGQSLK